MIMGNGNPAPALGNGEKIQDGLPGDGKLNQPTPMASPGWHQVEEAKPTMEDFTAEDWTLLSRQKKISTANIRRSKPWVFCGPRSMSRVSGTR